MNFIRQPDINNQPHLIDTDSDYFPEIEQGDDTPDINNLLHGDETESLSQQPFWLPQ